MFLAANTPRVREDETRRGMGSGGTQRHQASQPLLLRRLRFQRESSFPMTTTQILLAKRELAGSLSEGGETYFEATIQEQRLRSKPDRCCRFYRHPLGLPPTPAPTHPQQP